ncbi:Deoxyribonuclease V [Rippkaea orientalis PCC 8801]|uniref:Endonuclease V n=1 Tax=Rippkaea orientalis (strain PCC 8801 / RF-1) TaxID=41431 RepID=NFI_RIPO1|nr:deoxyribonuclease V [Rippkaea orientalis]B7K379.1 RecName: Full=Endonuclease V; AltName: Full=Deoxyinosine 3'endonuclease; AltName: Full=Deoxyribonuclease V; Short=DNase V [Rippkaea orientalis PCC 8801]ACK64399.1 Deoxyribonuclease V [Rippkaea orientalis PCC 8801]
MKIKATFSCPHSLEEAKTIQENLKKKVILEDQFSEVNYVAGVDVGFRDNYQLTQAAIAVLSFPKLELVETQIACLPTTFPYIPGFLSFREIPAILKALEKLKIPPNIILCDGQGIAHPRRLGIASHLGVLIDLPTIGVAKSLLVGKHEEVPPEKGNWQPLIDKGEIIGVVLRSRTNIKPIYVSIGHKISLPTAIDYVMQCLTKYRLPETTRWADKLASNKGNMINLSKI